MPTALQPTMPVTNPGQNIYDAQTELAKRKRSLLGLNDPTNPLRSANNATGRAGLELYNPSNPLRAASNQGKRSLLDATGRYSGMQRSYYGTVGQMNTERSAETNRLIDASHDTADLTAVAQAAGHRNAVNALRDSVGMARPIEINTPQGDNTPLPVGVARSLRSNADYINETNRNNEAVRGNELAALKNGLDVGNLDVGDVRRQGQYADLNLSDAEQSAGYADKLSGQNLQDALNAAGFQVADASANVADAQRAPYGQELYIDPRTGESRYVSLQEKDLLDLQTSRQNREQVSLNEIPAQYNINQARNQYSAQQEGLGGLSPTHALSMLTAGTLASAGLTVEDLHRALIKSGLSPNAAFALITQAQDKTKNPGSAPLAAFDESDFVHWLTRDVDPSEPSPIYQVQAELARRFPNNPQAVQIKLQQLIQQAKKAKTGGGPTITRPSFGP